MRWKINVKSSPTEEAQLLYRDSYITIVKDSSGHYVIIYDKRRKVNNVAKDNWIILFFGNDRNIHKRLKGRVAKNDKNLLITIYGRNARSYILYDKRKELK